MIEEKRLVDEMQQVWHQMKAALDDQEAERAEVRDAIERMNSRLDQLERSYRARAERPALEIPAEEYGDEDTARLKAQLSDPQYKRLFVKMLRKGYAALSRDERKVLPMVSGLESKALVLSDDTAAGFLAPAEFEQSIIETLILMSNVRAVANVRTTSARSVKMPIRRQAFSARWVSETGQRSETPGVRFGIEEVPTHEMYAEILISEQDLEDSFFDVESYMTNLAGEMFGVLEGRAFLSGTGIGQPEGILANSSVPVLTLGNSSTHTLSADDLLTVYHDLPAPYANTSVWLMHRTTIGAIRKMKTTGSGEYIWAPPGLAGQTATLLDRPYYDMPDMPQVSQNAKAIIFGDVKRGYTIVDRVGTIVKRLVEKYAEQGQIGFLLRRRVGGQVVLGEAMRIVQVA